MPIITLTTQIVNKREIIFDLARSLDLHNYSTKQTNERIISGRKTGLMQLNETVTWSAKHLGIYQNLTAKITELDYPNHFKDEMVKGAFHSFSHIHTFKDEGDITLMTDTFQFKSPFGFIGSVFDFFILEKYMLNFLVKRNEVIKKIAETEDWKKFINLE